VKKINVLFIIVQMNVMGGSESLVRNLIRSIDRHRFNPSIAWFYGDNPLQEYVELNIPLHHVPKTKRLDFQTMRQFSDIIRKNDIDVVNAHHFLSMAYSYYGCKMKNHRGLIYTEHSEWEIDAISWKWQKVGSYMLNRSDRSIGVGKNVTKKLKSVFSIPENKAITINNGVDINTFHENRRTTLSKKQLGLESNDKVIGMVANFWKVKNHIFLLQAFKELLKYQETAKLILVGTEPEGGVDNTLPEVLQFIESENLSRYVHILGYRSDVPELLKIMDVFCLTSLKEGLPIGLIEAMAVGLPVIGTNVEGIRDTISNGKNGYLVELNDKTMMIDSLNKLLLDEKLREEMGRESSLIARNKFSLKECLDKYQKVIISASAQ
jgi:glycosyltransferase involved in cell wall biosynthesis